MQSWVGGPIMPNDEREVQYYVSLQDNTAVLGVTRRGALLCVLDGSPFVKEVALVASRSKGGREGALLVLCCITGLVVHCQSGSNPVVVLLGRKEPPRVVVKMRQ